MARKSEILSTEDRRGKFGDARPAFTVHRFKRTIPVMLNEEMAAELVSVLDFYADSHANIPPHLYTIRRQIQEALAQHPPGIGEKPAVLAPGRAAS